MSELATQYSKTGDAHFDQLVKRFPGATRDRLSFAKKLPADRFSQIRTCAAMYLSACLGSARPLLDEQELKAALLERRGRIWNHGPTGQVVPTREVALEFNLLHRAVAATFGDFGLEDVIEVIDLPFSMRMVYGEVDPSRPLRPYASAKPHSDVWAGVPPDAMVVVMPLIGDIEHITIEFGEIPPAEELQWMRRLPDFNEGKECPIAVPYHDVGMKLGHLYVADARALHRTVRRKPEGVRVSLDFRFRLKNNQHYRRMVEEANRERFELELSTPYERWLQMGSREAMTFTDTLAEAEKTGRIQREGPDYGTKYRAVTL